MSLTKQLIDMLSEEHDRFSSNLPVSAEVLASLVMDKIDEAKVSPELVAWACVLELRQLSRPLLRRLYEENPDQEELFELQERYPGFGSHKGKYIPRNMMTKEDYEANIDRLKNEANAKLKHANALEAEMLEKEKRGELGICA